MTAVIGNASGASSNFQLTRTVASAASQLRVLHAVLSLDPGGLERVVVALVRRARLQGQEANVLCLERTGALAKIVEAAGGRVVCAHKPPGLKFGTIRAVNSQLDSLRPNIVHTHQIGALFYVGGACQRTGIPVVHTEHGKHYGGIRARWLGRLAARRADRLICVSDDIAESAVRRRVFPERKVQVVPNGIDLRPFDTPLNTESLRRSLNIPSGAVVLGTIGRLAEIKRHELLVRAFARVRSNHPDAHLVIVGDGPLRDELSGLSSRLGVGQWVHLVGYQEEPQSFLRAMDVFCLTSRSEGMPLVILEAWAARVPLIASRVGGIPELVEDGQTGLLFCSGDEQDLAQTISKLLGSAELRVALVARAREAVEGKYTQERMCHAYEEEYFRLAARRRPKGRTYG